MKWSANNGPQRAALVLSVSGLLLSGCAVIDAQQGLCEALEHCATDMACTTSGCQPLSQFGLASSCTVASDCRANVVEPAPKDAIDCPEGRVCECVAGGCVYTDSGACDSDESCGVSGYCDNITAICRYPFSCGSHSDCGGVGEVCTTDGCIHASAATCGASCPGSSVCVYLACFYPTATGCHASDDCGAGQLCLLPEGKCYQPAVAG